MLKREITYEDFDGNELTEVFYFNISKAELVELEVEVEEGMAEWLQKIVKAENRKAIVQEFKRLILFSYGERSDDGKRFVKTPQMREDFEHHAAYPVLFMELATDDKAGADFVNGVLPKDVTAEIATVQETADPTVTTPAPPQASA